MFVSSLDRDVKEHRQDFTVLQVVNEMHLMLEFSLFTLIACLGLFCLFAGLWY